MVLPLLEGRPQQLSPSWIRSSLNPRNQEAQPVFGGQEGAFMQVAQGLALCWPQPGAMSVPTDLVFPARG